MKIVVSLARPKTDKEQLFRVEAEVDDLKNPGVAYVTLGKVEYRIEIYSD